MMKMFRLSLGGSLLALLVLASACTSPLTTLVGGKPPVALGANEAQLVFNAGNGDSRAITGDTYLTVQLKSAADGTVKFASATGANGTYTVTIGGMVAGDWALKVMLYDSPTTQVLKYYGNVTQHIAVATSNNVKVPLYTPGTINGVTLTDALLTDHVTILDPNGTSGTATPQPVVIGASWDLDALAYANATDLATQPGVLWTSSDENVATVTASGRVYLQKKGSATITALSAENPLKTATYKVMGVPPMYGTWKQILEAGERPNGPSRGSIVWTFDVDTFVQYFWDSEGDAEIVRGNYSYSQGVLKFANLEMFAPATKTWVQPVESLPPESLSRLVNLTSETMTMAELESLVVVQTPYLMGSQAATRTMAPSTSVATADLYVRVPLVPLTGITLGGVASGGTLTLPQKQQPSTLGLQGNTPAAATITGLYWTSDTPAVVGYNGNNEFVALAASGTALVKAYALNDLDTPVVTYTVNTSVNNPPLVTFTPTLGTIGFSITDEHLIQGYTWGITGGTITTEPGPYSDSLGKTATGTATIPVTAGDYTLTVTTWDHYGNTQAFTHPFTVEAPQVSFTATQEFNAGDPIAFTLTDVEGVASFTWNNGYDSGNVTVDGLGATTVNFSILAPAGPGTHELTVTGLDVRGTSETFSLYYTVNPS